MSAAKSTIIGWAVLILCAEHARRRAAESPALWLFSGRR
jgi:hypothetical protein